MNLKTRLFGPPWESKDASVRAQAVAGENHPDLLAQLERIAREDSEAAVRIVALRRLGQPEAWLHAALDDPDKTLKQQADHALLRLVRERLQPDVSAQPRWREWVAGLESADPVRRLARDAGSPDLRRLALERIQSQGFLGDCLISEPDDAIAREILERINQPSTLKRISSQLRKRHKIRHEALLRHMANLEQDSGRHEKRDELALKLVRKMEALARGERIERRREEAEELEHQWNDLDTPDAPLALRFEGALAIVHKARAAPKKTPVGEAAPAPKHDPTDPELTQLAELARQLAASPIGQDTGAKLSGLLSQFDRRWNTLGRHDQQHEALRQHFQALVSELQARVQQDQKPQASKKEKPAEHEQEENQERPLLEEFGQLVNGCDQALGNGDIAAAHEALRKARSALDRIPGRARPRQAEGRMQRLAGKLKELRDWQHWSNNELRERLIERVTEIDAANLHPDAVTQRLKELRERWQDLDRQEILPGDKRRFAAPQGQWRRFQQACKQAFEAARPWLEKRSELRKESLQELKAFLEQARKLAASENADPELLLRHQRAAREAIRNLDTLPPKSRGKMAAALRDLMDSISGRLDQHFDAVAGEKRRLILEARKLVHEKDRARAVDQAKKLQAEWKNAGRTRRKLDDQLWREFREPIDPLFEDLKTERSRQRDAEREHQQELVELCREAEELASSDQELLEDGVGLMNGLEGRFNKASAVPPALGRRFANAAAEFRDRLSAFRVRRRRQADEQLMSLAGQLQQAWTDLVEGRKPDWSLPDPVPDNPAAAVLVKRLEQYPKLQLPDEKQPEVDQKTDLARQVVIEMECLSGIESPPEDRQRRMDFQVNRLSSRLGEGARRPDLVSERAQLQRRWLESFPHDPESHAALEQRFRSAHTILDEMATS